MHATATVQSPAKTLHPPYYVVNYKLGAARPWSWSASVG